MVNGGKVGGSERPKLAAATIWNQLENQFQLEEATHQQKHLRGWINNRVERGRNRYNRRVGNIGDEMKKSWKRSKNAMTIFWRRGTEGKATHCKQKTEKEKRKRSVCKERRKDTKRDEHLSALGGANLHRHSHPLQGSLSLHNRVFFFFFWTTKWWWCCFRLWQSYFRWWP